MKVNGREGGEGGDPARLRGARDVGRSSSSTARSSRVSITPFLVGMGSAAALTGGIALVLYTGQGFLRTAGMLFAVVLGALTAGLWAGDDGSRSTRMRALAMVFTHVTAAVFASLWAVSPELRDTTYGGSLAVLLLLALPSYVTGALLVGLHRHSRSPGAVAGLDTQQVGVKALAGATIGVFAAATYLIPNIEAWGVFFAASVLMVPSALIPAARAEELTTTGGTMRDRVAIITGVGSAGQLGYAIAQQFVAAGARLVVVGFHDDIRSIATELGPRDRVIGVVADLTKQNDVDAVMAAARSYGRVDALVNIAGGLTVMATAAQTTGEMFRHEMSINAETTLLMSRAALPLLRESRGSIVNFASPAGERAVAGLTAYSAAKASVIALTRAMALEEIGNGVRVNAVAPGMVDTVRNREVEGEGAVFVPREDVGSVVLFLVGEGARGVSGEVVRVLGEGIS